MAREIAPCPWRFARSSAHPAERIPGREDSAFAGIEKARELLIVGVLERDFRQGMRLSGHFFGSVFRNEGLAFPLPF